MFGRTTVLIALAVALALPASAPARQAVSSKAPTGLKAFLLSYNEPTAHSFTRTPSFAWKPTSQALSYDFQLATSSSFRENSIWWSADGLKTPYTSVPLALPWVTGNPYSLFARVRAHLQRSTTPWSADFGFNVRWNDVPAQLSAPNGLLRWTPIDGATEYEVRESGTPSGLDSWVKNVYVATNVSDMRDWFTFHQTPLWVGTAYWRVRAVRVVYGTLQNGHPITSFGPWSRPFQTHATPPTASQLTLGGTTSDVTGTVAKPAAHKLMPGFSWNGNTSGGVAYELYRVYVFSDEDCVQPVLTGSIVGSPAWVPRLSGPLALPESIDDVAKARSTILGDGAQTSAFDYSRTPVTTSETVSGGSSISTNQLDLWDRKWPSGVYYWTVMPVRWQVNALAGDAFEYQDTQAAQDACAAGRRATFGIVSQPVPTSGNNAFVTSLSLSGKMTSAAASRSPRVYGSSTLVTWTPALAADEYEVQWSHTSYPFQQAGSVTTPGTSATLSLTPGTWYYRVRGLDLQMNPSAQSMAWSSVRKIKIAKPVFRLTK
ncbi:MAG: hypothetical protein ABSC36_02800 [Gaiellaceae bacterium]|jgi:hypothetical protein